MKSSISRTQVVKHLKDIYGLQEMPPFQREQVEKHSRNIDKVLGMLVERPSVTVSEINHELKCNDGGRYVRFLSEAGFEIERVWKGRGRERSYKEYRMPDSEKTSVMEEINS